MTGSVYLAGPITGRTYDGGNDWRELAKKELGTVGIQAWSPLRAKEYLRKYGVLDDAAEADYFDELLSSPRGIMTRDRWDCTRVDVVLVNLLGATRISIGTTMEIAWADGVRTPIVCMIEKEGNPHDHAMIQQALGFRVETFEEGIEVCKALLTP